jgi:hypothetical protein
MPATHIGARAVREEGFPAFGANRVGAALEAVDASAALTKPPWGALTAFCRSPVWRSGFIGGVNFAADDECLLTHLSLINGPFHL